MSKIFIHIIVTLIQVLDKDKLLASSFSKFIIRKLRKVLLHLAFDLLIKFIFSEKKSK